MEFVSFCSVLEYLLRNFRWKNTSGNALANRSELLKKTIKLNYSVSYQQHGNITPLANELERFS